MKGAAVQTDIDPEWAWAEFRPSADDWNIRTAAHLFRRAGFGATVTELQDAVKAGPAATIDSMFRSTAERPAFITQMQSLANAGLATGNPKQLSAWWAYRMLATPAQLLEKLTLFWHGHFATSAEKVGDAELMFEQNSLLRQFALGDFLQLVLQISRDPAMLIYLDSATNRKAHPNENFAREIMELFCLGEGHYSENDIRELARCFTGWEVRRRKFRFNRYQHDTGAKSILGETGEFGGEQGVQVVVRQKAAPRFIVSRLVRFLVMDEPECSAELIEPLVAELRESQMNVRSTVRRILSSNLFFSQHSVGRKVKSPVELAIGFLRTFEGSTNTFELAEAMQQLGQGLFYPPSVKGWDGGRTWINSSTLLGRSNLIRHLLEHDKTRFAKQSLSDYLSANKLAGSEALIDFFERTLFAIPIPSAAKLRISKLAGNMQTKRQQVEAIHAICTLPEFQLG